MAFLKFANAIVKQPDVGLNGLGGWNNLRSAAMADSSAQFAFNKTAGSLNLKDYSPDKFLLTHCTIIASVDVDEVPNVKTGEKVIHQGSTIRRPHNDYHITPETDKYVNQNGDAWERKLLMGTFRTFIGAENYVEHIQIPELSKGKVVDAVARDLDDTIYVDILVATDRKHGELVADIEAGKINTLSMGCSIQYSLCTKCGNVAADETELCSHVKYQKGNHFHDHAGKKRVIAELCGHHTDPESVTFIEASWVANPAFKGAVLRSILNGSGAVPEEVRAETAAHHNEMVASSPMLAEFMEAQNIDSFLRTAKTSFSDELESLRLLQNEMRQVISSVQSPIQDDGTKEAFGFDDEEEEEGDGEEEATPIDKVKKDLKDKLRQDVRQELEKELKEDLNLNQKEPMFTGPPEKEDVNDNVIEAFQAFSSRYASELKDSSRLRRVFKVVYDARQKGWTEVSKISRVQNKDIIAAMYLKDRDFDGKALNTDIYACLAKVGGASNYSNVDAFMNACSLALGRKPTEKEAKVLVKRSKVLK